MCVLDVRVCVDYIPPYFPPLSSYTHTHTHTQIHRFDGSGYIHSVLLDPDTQTVNYSGQFVQTPILKVCVSACVCVGIYNSAMFISACMCLCVCFSLHPRTVLQYPTSSLLPRGGRHNLLRFYGSARMKFVFQCVACENTSFLLFYFR